MSPSFVTPLTDDHLEEVVEDIIVKLKEAKLRKEIIELEEGRSIL